VLIALAILGLALGAIATVFGNGILGHATASDVDAALALAEDKLAAAGVTEPLKPSNSEGVFADRFTWRLAIARYDDKDASADGPTPALRLYRLDITVAWNDGGHARQVALGTLRLAPAPP
jgi:general secretion pathway protein I